MYYIGRPTFSFAMGLVDRASEIRGVDPRRVAKRERTHSISYTRFGVVWVMRQLGFSYPRIAKALSFEDHTSVIHAERRAEQFRRDDPDYRDFTDLLLAHGHDLRFSERQVA